MLNHYKQGSSRSILNVDTNNCCICSVARYTAGETSNNASGLFTPTSVLTSHTNYRYWYSVFGCQSISLHLPMCGSIPTWYPEHKGCGHRLTFIWCHCRSEGEIKQYCISYVFNSCTKIINPLINKYATTSHSTTSSRRKWTPICCNIHQSNSVDMGYC